MDSTERTPTTAAQKLGAASAVMSNPSTDRKRRAAKIRVLAKEAEDYEAVTRRDTDNREANGVDGFFTCNRIQNEVGREDASAYIKLFVDGSENAVWRLEGECMPWRVLALCFYAAMVEAGDA